jgi:uncharacterized membrane protein YfcA
VKVKLPFQLNDMEKFITHDPKLIFTSISHISILTIYINLSLFQSPIMGAVASFSYFLINTIFLAHAFFEKEKAFFRLMFGVLLLIMLLGFVGWLVMIIHSLDVPQFVFALFIVTLLSSWSNKRKACKDATEYSGIQTSTH